MPKKSIRTNSITDTKYIPELKCIKLPSKGCNDGYYQVSIPLKYMIAAYEKPAAFFVFKFIGMKKGDK